MKELFIEAPNEAARGKPSLEGFRSAADNQVETLAGGLAVSGKGRCRIPACLVSGRYQPCPAVVPE